jgi:Amt family ammonium transporter
MGVQATAVLAAFLYSAVATAVLLKVIGLVFPLRGSVRDEGVGMDILNHGEEAYVHVEGAILLLDEEINGKSA